MASSSDSCGHCGQRLVWARTGRPARYCSTRCRVAAHRARPRQLVIDQVADDQLPEVDTAAPGPAPLLFLAADHPEGGPRS